MYIKKIELVNFQVIKEFTADFTGNVYFISGENELGKSTLLKAIGVLLTGQRDDVLRIGEKKGFAKMVVGDDGKDYEVSLSFTEANPRGTLCIKSGGMQSKNVSMLQDLFGYQDFDAMEFLGWSETKEGRRRQVKVVKRLLPADVLAKLDECDRILAEEEQKRLEVGREVKTAQAVAEEVAKGLPEDREAYRTPRNLTELLEQQKQAAALIEKAKTVRAALAQRTEQLNTASEARKRIEDEYNKTVEDAARQMEEIIKKAKADYETARVNAGKRVAEQLEELNKNVEDWKVRKANAETWLTKYEEEKVEDTDFSAKIAEITAYNDMVGKITRAEEKEREFRAKNAILSDCLDKIAEVRKAKADAILGARLPINGLTFDEDGLKLRDVPFEAGKISDSQAMEVAAKLVIASNPKVKVFRIARGESLGKKRLEQIVAIASKYGYQGFIEQVQRGQNEMKVEEYTDYEDRTAKENQAD